MKNKFYKSKYLFIVFFVCLVVVSVAKNKQSLNYTGNPIEMSTFPPDYTQCDGDPLFTNCQDESCISDGLERRVFDIWKEKFLSANNIDDKFFEDHFEITDVVLTEGKYKFVRISYVYKNDWVRSRDSMSINIGTHDNEEVVNGEPSNWELGRDVDQELSFNKKQCKFKESVISTDEAKAALDIGQYVNYDFCDISFSKSDGYIKLRGISTVDRKNNKCLYVEINLSSGKVLTHHTSCVLYE